VACIDSTFIPRRLGVTSGSRSPRSFAPADLVGTAPLLLGLGPARPPIVVARLAVVRRARRGKAHGLLLAAPRFLLQRPRSLTAAVPRLQVGAVEVGRPNVGAVGLGLAQGSASRRLAGGAPRGMAAGPRRLGRLDRSGWTVYADLMGVAAILQLCHRPVVVRCGIQAIIRSWLGRRHAGLGGKRRCGRAGRRRRC